MYSHGTSRPESLPLLNGFPFMTFPQLVCLFKTLVNQVAFNFTIYLLPGEFKGNLCTAVTLYITVTWPFPKGDRYIQVRLYVVRMYYQLKQLSHHFVSERYPYFFVFAWDFLAALIKDCIVTSSHIFVWRLTWLW